MKTPDDQPRRRLLWLLAASLLLNMFLVGFLIARATMVRPPLPPPMAHPSAAGPAPHMRRERDPGPMRMLMARHRPALRKQRRAIHAARNAVQAALVAEPFDQAKLSTALSELRAATSDAQGALHESLVEAAPSMSPEERAALSHAHRLWSGPGHRAGGRPGPRRPLRE